MDENPYEPPKTESRASPGRSTAVLVVLGVLSIPAGLICGGVTCIAVGLGGEVAAQTTTFGQYGLQEWGWFAGIPTGLLVLVAVPLAAIWLLVRRSRAR
jgi:hypothetical protein